MRNHNRRIKASYRLFEEFGCCSRGWNGLLDASALVSMMEDNMRLHFVNCLTALRIVQIENDKKDGEDADEDEIVIRKVFAGTISMITNAECSSDEHSISSFYPDEGKRYDDRGWVPMHCVIALTLENKVSEKDIHLLHAADPLAMHLLSGTAEDLIEVEFGEKGGITGYTPIHLLCMQKRPNISLVEYFCIRDPNVFYYLTEMVKVLCIYRKEF
jgi:hypothetical protein